MVTKFEILATNIAIALNVLEHLPQTLQRL